MSITTAFPSVSEVAQLLETLFGPQTKVAAAKAPFQAGTPSIVATYLDEQGQLQRVIGCDLAFSSYAGACLSMIPPGVAAESIKTGKIPENIFMNTYEVLNICVNIFSDTFRTRLVLGTVYNVGETVPPEALAALQSQESVSFDVELPRYGFGKLALAAV